VHACCIVSRRPPASTLFPYTTLFRSLACLALQRYVEAHDWLAQALLLEPGAADVRLAYGQALAELERFDELAQCLQGLGGEGLDGEQQRALAWLWAQVGRDEAALALYRQLLGADQADHDSRVRLALLLERLNRLDEAATELGQVAPDAALHDAGMLPLVQARVLRRRGQADIAITRLMPALSQALPVAMRAQLQFELAKCHDSLGAEGNAMAA